LYLVPYIFAGLIFLGYLAAFAGKRGFLWLWVGCLVIFAIAGFTDFYLWEYEYGHNLDPRAAIKVEGMTYQPPLIGYKQLLNFLAGSLPDVGGIAAGISGFLAVSVLFYEQRLIKQVK
jgi:copper chaperone NosL